MSKRNFILLIIVLSLVMIAAFWFLYSRKTLPPTGGDDGGGINFFSQFNPFGAGKPKPPSTAPPADISGYKPEGEDTSKMKLAKVSSMEVAGFTLFSKERLKEIPLAPLLVEEGVGGGDNSIPPRPSGTPPQKGGDKTKSAPPATEFALMARYAAKATGNIYQTFADKIEERKFSGTIIPKVYDAYFGNNGESVVMRYLKTDDKTIETFVGILPKEYLGADPSVVNEIKGSFLPDNVKDISVSPDASKIFYLFINSNALGDSMIGTTLSLLSNKKAQIIDSPFTEWLSSWPNEKVITLSTKPSAYAGGYMYTMDGSGKNLTNVLSGINGLTVLTSPSGKLILYSDSTLSLNVYHPDTRTSDLLGIATLPEKCVWNKASDAVYCAVPKLITPGAYPDSWYQGEVSFNDQLWKIDVKTGNATIIIDPATAFAGEEIDGIKLALDSSGTYLFFVNKKDSFLWRLNLK